LVRIVKSYNLSEDDVFAIRAVYDTMTGAYDAECVRVSEICEFMVRCVFVSLNVDLLFQHVLYVCAQELDRTKLLEWVVCGVNPASKAELSFTEYVYMLCFFIMFAKRELNQFLFGSMDVDNKMYLT
jgi:hypothetical protein